MPLFSAVKNPELNILNPLIIKEIAYNVAPWGFRYCLVVGRRDRMDDMSNQLRGELQRDFGVTTMSYDRLVDYVGLLHNGI